MKKIVCIIGFHSYKRIDTKSYLSDTGDFIGGMAIKRKYHYGVYKCKHCGDTHNGCSY